MTKDYEAAAKILGRLVRFADQPDHGTVYWCCAMKGDGSLVELLGMTGQFAPHLFVLAESYRCP